MKIAFSASGQGASPGPQRDGARCREFWDPAGPSPACRNWVWAFCAAFVVVAQGPSFLRQTCVTWNKGNDYFQDWASARNVLEGRPVYLPLSESLSRHFPRTEGSQPSNIHLSWNAHPPTSVLAILPLGSLEYPRSATLWNVLNLVALGTSLGLIARELNFPFRVSSLLPLATLGLLCSPFRMQVLQGQWNAAMLLLLTLAWVAERRGRDSWAGFWVGCALTLKLFPAFLLLYFASRRRWRALFAGCLWAITWSLATVAVLGPGAYRDYYHHVLPALRIYRAGWNNSSLMAFWIKNLAEGASYYGLYAEPVIDAPILARAAIVLSYASVLATTFFLVNRSGPGSHERTESGDLCYALAMVAMIWLAPICWDHYLVLLALPLALIWRSSGRSSLQRLAFLLLVAAVWTAPDQLWRTAGVDILADFPDFQDAPPGTYVIHRPFFVPFFLSVHSYALLATFLWLAVLARGEFAAGRRAGICPEVF